MSYDHALTILLALEGGYVNDPDDRGGATNYGITQRTYDAWRAKRGLGPIDVKEIGQDDVWAIYRTEYWDAAGCGALAWPLCLMHFDAAVNHGPGRAKKFLALARDPGVYLDLRAAFYRSIVAKDPTQARFLKGWLNRLTELREHINEPPRAA